MPTIIKIGAPLTFFSAAAILSARGYESMREILNEMNLSHLDNHKDLVDWPPERVVAKVVNNVACENCLVTKKDHQDLWDCIRKAIGEDLVCVRFPYRMLDKGDNIRGVLKCTNQVRFPSVSSCLLLSRSYP